EVWSADLDRKRCEDPNGWRMWLNTRVPSAAEGRVVLSRDDGYLGFELTITKCEAHSGGGCSSDMIGANAEPFYLTQQGYSFSASGFAVELVSENVLKIGEHVFHRQ